MEKDILLLYNPKAGDTFFRFELENFLNIFGKSGSTVRIFTSQYEGDMAHCIDHTHLEEIELIVVAGGDGSVNEVIQTIMKKEYRPKIGIIPAGTRNSIAKYLEMPDSYIQCMEVISRGFTEEINVGEVDGKFFMNICGYGNMMDIYRKTSQEMKNTFGKMAYFVNCVYHLPKEMPFQVKVEANGEVYEEELILFMVINSDGFRIRKAEKDLEEKRSLQFIGIKNKGKFTNRRNLIRSIWRIPKMGNNVISIISDDMIVSCENLPEGRKTCFVDGEIGCQFPLHFSLHREALKIITNRNVPRGTIMTTQNLNPSDLLEVTENKTVPEIIETEEDSVKNLPEETDN